MAGAARGGSAERLRGPKPVAGGGRHPRHPQPRVVGTSGDRARPPQKPSGVRAAQPLQASPQPAGAKNPSSWELFILEPTDGPAQSPGVALTHRQTPCHEPQHRHHNKNHPISTPHVALCSLQAPPSRGGSSQVQHPAPWGTQPGWRPDTRCAPWAAVRKRRVGSSRGKGEAGRATRLCHPPPLPSPVPAAAGAARCHPSSLVKEPPRHRAPASPPR